MELYEAINKRRTVTAAPRFCRRGVVDLLFALSEEFSSPIV